MADPTTIAAPTAPVVAPTPAPPPPLPISGLAQPAPPVAASAPALDQSTVQQPTQPPVNDAATLQAQLAPVQQNVVNATNTATKLAAAGVPTPPNVPHARLMDMIQGLALGLDSFGKAIATHGKEGGAQEVQEVNAQKQEMALKQKEFAQQQLNFKVQQQVTIADTNRALAQTIMNLHSLPTDLQAKDVAIKGETQRQGIEKADFQATHMGLNPDQFSAALNSTSGPTDTQTSNLFRNRAQQTVDLAAQNPELGPNDPYVKGLQTVLQNPNATPKDLWTASQQLETQAAGKTQVTAAKSAAAAAAATARPKDLNDAVGRLTQAETAYASNPTPENKQAVTDAQTARENFLSAEAAEARVKQAAQDGDPNALAQSLVNDDVAWSQVISTRRPEFAQAALTAANKLSIAQTGKPFSTEVNEAQFKQATNPDVQQKLKMIGGMTDKGGSIEIAETAASKLPQFNEETANKVFNIVSGELGNANISNFHTAMLGLADEYSQVMGAGAGSDSSRQQALDLLHDAYSKGQLAGAIGVMRQDIAARKKTLINDNPALNALFNKTSQQNSALPGNNVTVAPAGSFQWPTGSVATGPR